MQIAAQHDFIFMYHFLWFCDCKPYEPAQEKRVLITKATVEGSGEPAQSRQSLRSSLTQYMGLEKASDKEPHILPFWVAVHAGLKDHRPRDPKAPFLMRCLICRN